MSEPPSSAERLALAGLRRDLNSVQHAVARDRIIKGRADMCAVTEVTCEADIRLGEIGARALLRWRPAILLWHRQDLQCLILPIPPMHRHFEELVVAAERFFFSGRRRHTRCLSDWSSDVCSSD